MKFKLLCIKGLNTEISYIRMQFITFLNQCILILSQFLVHPSLTNSIKSILASYYEIVLQLQNQEEEEGAEEEEEVEFFGLEELEKNQRMSVFTVWPKLSNFSFINFL